ncbi:MAG TPA: alpha/beta fold hydrolase [Syntrophomonadaceae bacterium]|nr:alpha/beta fold hydrolase [Syntrophomonadaceae bacterium]
MSELVGFLNAAGERLVGDLDLPPGRNPEYVVVVCHGFLGTRRGGGRAVVLGERLAAAGYGVLRFDFAGSGESEGDFASATLTKNAADLQAALDFLTGMGYRKFIALGRSFGGNAVLVGAARDRRIQGVCLWSTPVDMAAVLRVILGEDLYQAMLQGNAVTFDDGYRTYTKKADFLQDLGNYRMQELAAALSPRPVLIVHGEADELVPVENARLLFRAAGEPRELFLIPGGNHHLSEHQHQAVAATLGWLQRHF